MVVPYDPSQEPDGLLDDLPRGRSAKHVGTPSNAHFESPSNLLATESLRFEAEQNPHSKLFLGVVGGRVVTGKRLPDGRTNRWVEGGTPLGLGDDRHHLLIAGSRAGKGRGALLPNMLTLPATTSILKVDPKGASARTSARFRAEVLKQRVGVLDPFHCSGEGAKKYRCVYNPIETLQKSDRRLFTANARMIADALVVKGDFKDKHWDEVSSQMIAALCAHVATHANYIGMRNLVTVWKLASELTTPDPNNDQTFWLENEMLASDAPTVRAAAREFYSRAGGEFSSVLSSLRKHLAWIGFECMEEVLVGESIDLRDLKRDFLTLYLSLPAMRMDALRGWLRLIVQMTLAAFEEEQVLRGNQCVLMLDEFHALGRLSSLESAVAQVAGLGAKLYLALQNMSQLHCYGKNYETFLANAGCVQVMGCADDTTLKYLSERLGQAQTLNLSTNAPTFDQAAKQGATGESWAMASHPLMTAEEIGRYFSRDDKKLRQLILRPGFRPMITQRAFYDKHELFRGRYDGGRG